MAGPSAVVLLRKAWTAPDVDEFLGWLAISLSPDTGTGWWVLRDPHRLDQSEPLATGPLLIEPSRYESDDDEETAGLTHAIGFTPATEIVFAAAVNGKDDHRLLALLAAATARRYGGFISLDGLLPVPSGTTAPTPLDSEHPARSRTTIMTLSGQWHEIEYRTAWGEVATYHVVDAELLTSWLHHPHFRLAK